MHHNTKCWNTIACAFRWNHLQAPLRNLSPNSSEQRLCENRNPSMKTCALRSLSTMLLLIHASMACSVINSQLLPADAMQPLSCKTRRCCTSCSFALPLSEGVFRHRVVQHPERRDDTMKAKILKYKATTDRTDATPHS